MKTTAIAMAAAGLLATCGRTDAAPSAPWTADYSDMLGNLTASQLESFSGIVGSGLVSDMVNIFANPNPDTFEGLVSPAADMSGGSVANPGAPVPAIVDKVEQQALEITRDQPTFSTNDAATLANMTATQAKITTTLVSQAAHELGAMFSNATMATVWATPGSGAYNYMSANAPSRSEGCTMLSQDDHVNALANQASPTDAQVAILSRYYSASFRPHMEAAYAKAVGSDKQLQAMTEQFMSLIDAQVRTTLQYGWQSATMSVINASRKFFCGTSQP